MLLTLLRDPSLLVDGRNNNPTTAATQRLTQTRNNQQNSTISF